MPHQSPLPPGIPVERRQVEIIKWPPTPRQASLRAYLLAVVSGVLLGLLAIGLIELWPFGRPIQPQVNPDRAVYSWQRFYRVDPRLRPYDADHSAYSTDAAQWNRKETRHVEQQTNTGRG